MEKVRFGIIGVGNQGHSYIVNIFDFIRLFAFAVKISNNKNIGKSAVINRRFYCCINRNVGFLVDNFLDSAYKQIAWINSTDT